MLDHVKPDEADQIVVKLIAVLNRFREIRANWNQTTEVQDDVSALNSGHVGQRRRATRKAKREVLVELLEKEFGEWPEVVDRVDNTGRNEPDRRFIPTLWKATLYGVADVLSDNRFLPNRITDLCIHKNAVTWADALAVFGESLYEYVRVDVCPSREFVPLVEGWELRSMDEKTDGPRTARWPRFDFDDPLGSLYASNSFGMLRRVPGDLALDDVDDKSAMLVWPMLILNLLPDRSTCAYEAHVSQPRLGAWLHDGRATYQPSELGRLRYDPASKGSPDSTRNLSPMETDFLARLSTEVGLRISRFDRKTRTQLSDAAYRYIRGATTLDSQISSDKTDRPPSDPGDGIFRMVSSLEPLLTRGDSDNSDLTRKISQRTAVLLGRSDSERIDIRDVIRAGYAARSAYAHGRSPKATDSSGLREVVRRSFISWLGLAGVFPPADIPRILDDGLLSEELRRREISHHVDGLWESLGRHCDG